MSTRRRWGRKDSSVHTLHWPEERLCSGTRELKAVIMFHVSLEEQGNFFRHHRRKITNVITLDAREICRLRVTEEFLFRRIAEMWWCHGHQRVARETGKEREELLNK